MAEPKTSWVINRHEYSAVNGKKDGVAFVYYYRDGARLQYWYWLRHRRADLLAEARDSRSMA